MRRATSQIFSELAINDCIGCFREPRRPGQRWGVNCHAAYMREWRKTHPPSEEQRRRDVARSYAQVYKRRGLLIPEPCWCGEEDVVMHHDDYDRPIDVVWLCRPHHQEHHRINGNPGDDGYIPARRRPA